MKLDIKALALAGGLLWGAAVFFLGLTHAMWPSYGEAFLGALASVYPGYTGAGSAAQIILGTGYALVDGGIAAGVLAWLYNCVSAT